MLSGRQRLNPLNFYGLLLIVSVTLTLTGCCCGGDAKEESVIEKQSIPVAPLGEELIKLKEAHEMGALADQEDEAAKKNLLKE